MDKFNFKAILLFFIWYSEAVNAEHLNNLKTLSLEQLSQTTIELASKKEQNINEVASAAYVITQEDIRRSGATSLPELFRGIPGFNVAQVDGNKWAVSSRGFNKLFSNKMLVMIDGRSIYDPLFSGVYWADYDLILPDIKKIEVIRGPGATLWGSNAVNGVINIITKSTKDTRGLLVQAGSGSYENGIASVRYGGELSDDLTYRVYAKYINREDYVDFNNNDAADETEMARGGFRIDWQPSQHDQVNFQGEVFGGEQGQSINISQLSSIPIEEQLISKGGFLQSDWVHQINSQQEVKLGMYYSHLYKDETLLRQKRDILNLDLQHQINIIDDVDITWGLGYRFVTDSLQDKQSLFFSPNQRDTHLLSTFIQTDLNFFDEFLNISLGSKLEHNDFSGFELQPSVRALLNLSKHHKLWGAVSRAVRTPSRADHDLNINIALSPRANLNLLGNDNFDSEDLLAYEMGFRFIPNSNFKLDISGFYNQYKHLVSNERQTPSFSNGKLTIPVLLQNKAKGETYGIELASQWQLHKDWRVQSSYTWLKMDIRGQQSNDPNLDDPEGESPQHQFSLHSFLNLPFNAEFDAHWYYVDNLSERQTAAYHRLDLRIGWHPVEKLELSFAARNLLDPKHPETSVMDDGGIMASQIERSFYTQATFRF